MTTNRLKFDPSLAWIPIVQAAKLLNVHPSQVRRDRAVVEALGLITYTKHSGGFSPQDFEVLWIFRQLVKERGRKEAIKAITQQLEEYRERER
ncbi:hypothetical protein [Halotia branconii]|uniref:Uncharacterized protein n=1 Tax=Halotia branconii CENA392 TaxID=1539056 RepID=A0AAJ6NNJ9_9CYAN|nr:hypothetical protein [Halotia branconii]WGV23691.1 hypothetical protein QI031_17960 [Halotia branconii CENA392]